MNSLLTFSLDARWRDRAARECLAAGAVDILDLCCGTGDLALALHRVCRRGAHDKGGGKAPHITGLDFCPTFLDHARARARSAGAAIDFVEGDAGAQPFADASFDAVTLGFAFRNLTYRNPLRDLYLSEILRVLRPGGRLVFVETSQPENALFRFFNHLYLRSIVPLAGGLLAGSAAAYRYLADSAVHFLTRRELAALLLGAGFTDPQAMPLCFGAVALVSAKKPAGDAHLAGDASAKVREAANRAPTETGGAAPAKAESSRASQGDPGNGGGRP